MQVLVIITVISTAIFQPNNIPRALRILGLTAAKGSAASRVPAGQMNLQKAGIPMPST